jgi:TolB-like protein/Tfp pilus assembly protein PilF
VVAAALAIAAAAVWYVTRPKPSAVAAAQEQPSIAVMAFVDMSPNRDQEYLADGVAEEIIGELGRVPGLRVIGRTSSFSFKKKDADLRTIGAALAVGWVLEGSVRTEGNRVRISAKLVRIPDGSPMWSESYDRELRGILALEQEIARAVAGALKARLLPKGRERSRTVDPEAYRKLQLARAALRQPWGRGAFLQAKELILSALERDATLVEAWIVLSTAQFGLGWYDGTLRSRKEGCSGARASLDRALAIDPEGAEAHRQRAFRRAHCSADRRGAEEDLARAESLEPGSPGNLRTRARLLTLSGETAEGAQTELRAAALEADPLSAWGWMHTARARLALGDHVGARNDLSRALDLAPGFIEAHFSLAELELLEGRPERAREAFALAAAGDQQGSLLGTALVQHALGRKDLARDAVSKLEQDLDDNAPYLASVYAWWGDADRAFALIDRALANGDPDARSEIFENILLQKLRSDPRHVALLRRLGVER